jgi:hypothetical protein
MSNMNSEQSSAQSADGPGKETTDQTVISVQSPPYAKVVGQCENLEIFPSGSVREVRTGKGRFDLLPPRAIRRLAKHFEYGAKKYGDRNWEQGQPISRFLDCALRHTFQAIEGNSDEDHLIAAAWNLLCAAETKDRIKRGILPSALDDLPTTYYD